VAIGDKTKLAVAILGKGSEPVVPAPEEDGESAAAGDLFDALVAKDRGAFQSALSSLWDIYMAKMKRESSPDEDEESY
jgi:hypothetical protein